MSLKMSRDSNSEVAVELLAFSNQVSLRQTLQRE